MALFTLIIAYRDLGLSFCAFLEIKKLKSEKPLIQLTISPIVSGTATVLSDEEILRIV